MAGSGGTALTPDHGMRVHGDGDALAGTPPGGRFSAAAPARSPFPAIAEYGFLSDLETTALVAADGTVEWLCLPRSDGPSVFGALLDRSAGSFRVAPVGRIVPTVPLALRPPTLTSSRRRGRRRLAGSWCVMH